MKQDTKKKRDKSLLAGFEGMVDGDGRNNAIAKLSGRVLKVLPPREREIIGLPILLSANKQFRFY